MSMTQLDSGQVIKTVFDESTGSLKTTSVGAEYNIDIRATDGDSVIVVGTTDGTVSGTQKAVKLHTDGRTLTTSSNSFLNLAANATTNVKSGAGILKSIVINTAGASSNVITVYDSLTATGTKIATIDSTSSRTLSYEIAFSTGLTLVIGTGTAADVTVSYL